MLSESKAADLISTRRSTVQCSP